jgi:hypothetical protein
VSPIRRGAYGAWLGLTRRKPPWRALLTIVRRSRAEPLPGWRLRESDDRTRPAHFPFPRDRARCVGRWPPDARAAAPRASPSATRGTAKPAPAELAAVARARPRAHVRRSEAVAAVVSLGLLGRLNLLDNLENSLDERFLDVLINPRKAALVVAVSFANAV